MNSPKSRPLSRPRPRPPAGETDGPGDAGRARRVLVVEDEPAIAGSIVRGLRGAGYDVELATDGAAAARAADRFHPELIVLDLNLPEQDGFGLMEELRAGPPVPIIVVTARTHLDDRLRSFDLGAVDYLPKPFWMEELLARIRMRLDPRGPTPARVVEWDGAAVDLDAFEVTVDGQPAGLTREEFAILAFLVERPGRAIPRSSLAELSDGRGDERAERTVDTHVTRIRRKLGAAAWRVATVWGVGYRFERRNEERTG